MNRIIVCLLLALSITITSCKDEHQDLKDGIYAELETSQGNILLELNYKKTPITVANFITLAEGKNTFASEECKGKRIFDEIKFHRVISKSNGDAEDFMIQTGDPTGTGAGGESIWGKDFADELTPKAMFNRVGVLAMANRGPNTNGSQFFITTTQTPWLNGKHTIFGYVANKASYDVVQKIENLETTYGDRPKIEQKILKAYIKK